MSEQDKKDSTLEPTIPEENKQESAELSAQNLENVAGGKRDKVSAAWDVKQNAASA